MYKLLSNLLYRFKGIRRLIKKMLQNRVISQSFYSGKIYFNAVDYSFLWLHGKRIENVDREIQDKLLDLSKEHEYFIDIGANIGIMTISVSLRNKNIKVIAYDPNSKIMAHLEKSVLKNKLSNRVKTVLAAVSNESGTARMDFSIGPFSGHLADAGTEAKLINLEDILIEYKNLPTLFKIDIEGYEKNLISIIINNRNPLHKYVIELHPNGLNGVSDPSWVVNELLQNDFKLEDMNGNKVNSYSDIIDWQNILCYSENGFFGNSG